MQVQSALKAYLNLYSLYYFESPLYSYYQTSKLISNPGLRSLVCCVHLAMHQIRSSLIYHGVSGRLELLLANGPFCDCSPTIFHCLNTLSLPSDPL